MQLICDGRSSVRTIAHAALQRSPTKAGGKICRKAVSPQCGEIATELKGEGQPVPSYSRGLRTLIPLIPTERHRSLCGWPGGNHDQSSTIALLLVTFQGQTVKPGLPCPCWGAQRINLSGEQEEPTLLESNLARSITRIL